jgi:Rrf2 family protein
MSAKNVQFSVAAHILSVLGFYYGQEVHSKALAESVNAEPTFVRKSLSKLAKAGLVVTTRGKNGAATLARAPRDITLLDIYRASGAPPAFEIHSYRVEPKCLVSCSFKPSLSDLLSEAQASFEQSLAKRTLADLVGEIHPSTR